MQGGDRNIKFCVTEIGDHQIFGSDPARFEGGHSRVAPHAVLQMHNRLADVQLGQVANQCVRVNGASVVLSTTRHALAKEIAFANQRPVIQGIDKTVLGRANHQIAAVIGSFVETQDPFWRHFDARQ
ncbi:hypothetical protein D3C71_1723830 [compost metagenome]